MAKRRGARRRRRGRFAFLYKLLVLLVACGAVVTALILFFRVELVVPTGQERYTQEEIIAASGVQSGDNLYLLNKYDVVERIQTALPYIEEIRINRKLPDTLLIDVKECAKPLALEQEGVTYLISTRGKIVEQVSSPEGFPLISGVTLSEPAVGSTATLAEETRRKEESLFALLDALLEADMLSKTDGIRLDDNAILRLDYDSRFTVELPYGADYPYKLSALQEILSRDVIQDNMTGTFDMHTSEERTYLKQNVR